MFFNIEAKLLSFFLEILKLKMKGYIINRYSLSHFRIL